MTFEEVGQTAVGLQLGKKSAKPETTVQYCVLTFVSAKKDWILLTD